MRITIGTNAFYLNATYVYDEKLSHLRARRQKLEDGKDNPIGRQGGGCPSQETEDHRDAQDLLSASGVGQVAPYVRRRNNT